ncbi:putative uncharacterized protein DDB_G0282133 [Copidosoma floridanum]|uniref:putative uncharacterized protein DDB_G0282133 n=1 Tax=Copidosoma floridanum TaxID=29053 RepID=UPI0006C9DC1A|nr:putative uncharacterized protein DDB_G0282133 [Copidosoma floridanum]
MFLCNPVAKFRQTKHRPIKTEPSPAKEQTSAGDHDTDDSNLICLSSDDEEVEVEEVKVKKYDKELENEDDDVTWLGDENSNIRDEADASDARSCTSSNDGDPNNSKNQNNSRENNASLGELLPALSSGEASFDTVEAVIEAFVENKIQQLASPKTDKSTQTCKNDFPQLECEQCYACGSLPSEYDGLEVRKVGPFKYNRNNSRSNMYDAGCSLPNQENIDDSSNVHNKRSFIQRTTNTSMYVRQQPYQTPNNNPNSFANKFAGNKEVQNYVNWRVRYLMRQYESRILFGFSKFMNYVTQNHHHHNNYDSQNANNFRSDQQNSNGYRYTQQSNNELNQRNSVDYLPLQQNMWDPNARLN